jgi:hypothetical protein
MSPIRPWLYIGKYTDTLVETWLDHAGIGAVLQLAEPVAYTTIAALYLAVEDGAPLPAPVLDQGLGFVLAQRQLGRATLIACGAGISRSAVFATAALKRAESISLLDALRAVRRAHPGALPHPRLWTSLCAYYHEDVPVQVMIETVRTARATRS